MDNKNQTVHIGLLHIADGPQESLVAFPIVTMDTLPHMRKDGLMPHYVNIGQFELAIWHNAPQTDAQLIMAGLESFVIFESQGIDLLVTDNTDTE